MSTPHQLLPVLAAALLAGCATTSPSSRSALPPRLPIASRMENLPLAAADLKDAGTDTPEHTLETLLWAQKTGATARKQAVTLMRDCYWQGFANPLPPTDHPTFMDQKSNAYDAGGVVCGDGAGGYLIQPIVDGRSATGLLSLQLHQALAVAEIGTRATPLPINLRELSPIVTDNAGELVPVEFGNMQAPIHPVAPPPNLLDERPQTLQIATILARKDASLTEVELDVREDYATTPAASSATAPEFACYDFVFDGIAWKYLSQTNHLLTTGEMAAPPKWWKDMPPANLAAADQVPATPSL